VRPEDWGHRRCSSTRSVGNVAKRRHCGVRGDVVVAVVLVVLLSTGAAVEAGEATAAATATTVDAKGSVQAQGLGTLRPGLQTAQTRRTRTAWGDTP
jgi:hypothetical protein